MLEQDHFFDPVSPTNGVVQKPYLCQHCLKPRHDHVFAGIQMADGHYADELCACGHSRSAHLTKSSSSMCAMPGVDCDCMMFAVTLDRVIEDLLEIVGDTQ